MENAQVMTAELRPMSLSEILDRTFTLYRNNFWLFCGLMAMPEVAIALISIIYFAVMGGKLVPPQPNPQNPFAALAGLQTVILAALVLQFFHAIFISMALGAVTLAVSQIYLGHGVSIRESYLGVSRRMPALFGLILLLLFILFMFVFVGVMAGMIPGFVLAGVIAALGAAGGAPGPVTGVLIFLVVIVFLLGGLTLGIWLMMRFAVAIPVFMLERVGVLDSLGRSGILTKGHRWRIFVSVVVMYVVVYAVQLLFGLPFIIPTVMRMGRGMLPLWIQVGTSVSGAIAGTIAGPLLMITMALIYYDVRIRKEAFDLEAMMAGLGTGGPAPAGGIPGVGGNPNAAGSPGVETPWRPGT